VVSGQQYMGLRYLIAISLFLAPPLSSLDKPNVADVTGVFSASCSFFSATFSAPIGLLHKNQETGFHYLGTIVARYEIDVDAVSHHHISKGQRTMNATFRNLSALAVAFSMSVTTSSAYSQGQKKGKAKGKQDVDAKGKNGREAGELSFGLEQFAEKNGKLPSGLQKKKDEEGALTQGLDEGGKRRKSTGKAKKGSNW